MIQAHRWEADSVTTTSGVGCVVAPEGDARCWFNVVAPDAEERAALAERLGLHELAVEDALRERQPPKLADYQQYLFLIVHTPVAGERHPTRRIAIFLGPTWIVSVTLLPLAPVQAAEQRMLAEPARFLVAPERVAHALLDQMIDGFEKRVDDLVDLVEALECAVSERAERDCLARLQDVRREASRLTRVLRTQRDVCGVLARTNHAVLSRQITPYLRSVYDHCLRVYDMLDGVRESLAAARDGYLSAVNNQLSDTMRVLTVIATIMMPLSLVAGIFGMNFEPMPVLRTPWGFWVTIGVMGGLAAGMIAWFRRRGWI